MRVGEAPSLILLREGEAGSEIISRTHQTPQAMQSAWLVGDRRKTPVESFRILLRNVRSLAISALSLVNQKICPRGEEFFSHG